MISGNAYNRKKEKERISNEFRDGFGSKISRNRERDDEINKRLLFEGWTVIRFWGTDIKKNLDDCIRVIEEAIFDVNMVD